MATTELQFPSKKQNIKITEAVHHKIYKDDSGETKSVGKGVEENPISRAQITHKKKVNRQNIYIFSSLCVAQKCYKNIEYNLTEVSGV